MYIKEGLVSVIIPAYNVERTIGKCLDSLVEQDILEAEYIIIDDGSTDETLDILRDYKRKYNKINICSQENSGVSEARNRGIEIANGEFVLFVDADDYLVSSNALSILKDAANRNNADVVVFGYEMGEKDQNVCIGYNNPAKICKKDNPNEFAKKTITDATYHTAVWNKFYRRNIISDNNIHFRSYKEVISEDCIFNAEIFTHINSVLFLTDILYHYEVNIGSLSHSKYYDNVVKRNINLISCMKEIFVDKSKDLSLFAYYYIETLFRVSNLLIYHNKASIGEAWRILSEYCTKAKSISHNIELNYCKATRVMKKSNKRVGYCFIGILLNCKMTLPLKCVLVFLSILRKRIEGNR